MLAAPRTKNENFHCPSNPLTGYGRQSSRVKSNRHRCKPEYDEVLLGNRMRRLIQIAVCLGALASVCQAEPRWCSTSGRDPSNKFFYPPIPRAARVWGTVIMRMLYEPNGKVVRFEPISGPAILSTSLQAQMSDWIMKTDASGDELCETLVIADFHLDDSVDHSESVSKIVMGPSILRMSVETQWICLCDPGGTASISWKDPFRHVTFLIKRGVSKLFGRTKRPWD